MNKKQLILPISILLGCIILGGFYYASEINKQKSIERQQLIDLQSREAQQQLKTKQDKQDQLDKKISECTSLGMKKAVLDKKGKEDNTKNSIAIYSYTEPNFYYNEKMDACLYKIEKTTTYLSSPFFL